MKVNNVCLECGKIFQSNYAECYCSDCKKARKIRGKTEPKNTIKDVVKRATNDGLSYGYETAKLEGRL